MFDKKPEELVSVLQMSRVKRSCPPCPSCLADTWTGGGFKGVATALSESSSIHSETLYNLTKDMSGLGLEPMSYTLLEPKTSRDQPWTEESRSLFQAVGCCA